MKRSTRSLLLPWSLAFVCLMICRSSFSKVKDRQCPAQRTAVISHRKFPIHELIPLNRGADVLFIQKSALQEGDLAFYKQYYNKVYDIPHYQDGTIEALIAKEHQKEPITKIIATYEFDLIRAGRMRDAYGIPGQTYTSACAFRDKITMKQLAQAAGIKVPKFTILSLPTDLITFQHVGFPFVLKPARGAGASGITILRNMDDVYECMSKLPESLHEGAYIMEEFIEGRVYHVDGIVKDGKILIAWPSVFIGSCLDAVHGSNLFGWHLLEKYNPLTKRLNQFTQKVIKALPIPDDFVFHLEAFIDKNNQIRLCEIASRPGGAGINDDWIESFGIDLYKDFVRLQAGTYATNMLAKEPSSITGWVLLPKTEGIVTKVPQNPPQFEWLIRKYTCVELGEKISNPTNILDFMFRGQIKATSEADFNAKVMELKAWLNENFSINTN